MEKVSVMLFKMNNGFRVNMIEDFYLFYRLIWTVFTVIGKVFLNSGLRKNILAFLRN